MKLQLISSKQLFLTNSNENLVFQQQHQFKIEHLNYTFSYKSLVPFEQLKETFSPAQMIVIQSELKLKQNSFGLKSAEDLDVYAIIFDAQYLTIFAIGEYQASLYKIYVEGVYRMIH